MFKRKSIMQDHANRRELLTGIDKDLKSTAKHTALFLIYGVTAITIATEFFIEAMNLLKI